MNNNNQFIVFGGGCFWCTEAIFNSLKGVVSVMPGYAGGGVPHPTYEQVCAGITGHAEVIKINYDPDRISLRDLLTVFFATHDPTTPNRQGADIGEQYRSIVLYNNEPQKQEAERFIFELENEKVYDRPIVTQVKPLTDFYEAEEYHRNFYANNPDRPYCQAVINPKLSKLKQRFKELIKD